ncbi:hypothetical protein Bca4012_016588 [Brassica carinata]
MSDEKKVAPIGIWTAVKPFVNGGASGMLAIDMDQGEDSTRSGICSSVTTTMLKNEGILCWLSEARNLHHSPSWITQVKMLTAKASGANDGKPLPQLVPALVVQPN